VNVKNFKKQFFRYSKVTCCMNWSKWMLFLMLAMACHQLQAQKILLLEKTKGTKRIKLREGDSFAFRVDGEKYAIKGELDMILDSAIVLDGEVYFLHSITAVLDFKKYAVYRQISKAAFVAIPSMLLITALHRGLNTNESPLIDKNALQVTGVFAAIGLAFAPFRVKKYQLDKNWQLRIIDITPG
jgi:hypothetical protein